MYSREVPGVSEIVLESLFIDVDESAVLGEERGFVVWR